MEDPIRPSTRTLIRMSAAAERKRRVAAVLNYFEKKDQPLKDAEGGAITAADVERLRKVVGFTGARISRNRYIAARHGAMHRAFEDMCWRGLVTVAEAGGDQLLVQATSSGITAVMRAERNQRTLSAN